MRKLFLFVLVLTSCFWKKTEETELSPERYFELGMYYYYKDKYDKAREYLNKVLFSGKVTDITDDAQFYIAMSYLNERNYETAESEFNFLITQFPNSEHREESEFNLVKIDVLKIKSVEHETEDLSDALKKIDGFLSKYPESRFKEETIALKNEIRSLLAEKIYKIGELYEKMGRFESAKIYYKEVIEKYPGTVWAEKAEKKLK